jgi:hypothetical protein
MTTRNPGSLTLASGAISSTARRNGASFSEACHIRRMQIRRQHSAAMGRYQRTRNGPAVLARDRHGRPGRIRRDLPRSARYFVVVQRRSTERRKRVTNSVPARNRRIRSARHESRSGQLLSVLGTRGRTLLVLSRLPPPSRIHFRFPFRWKLQSGIDRSLEHEHHSSARRISS